MSETGIPVKTSLEKRTERLLFLTVLLACSWFFSVGSWNQNSRYDAIFAFCENEPGTPRTFAIDRFIFDPERGGNTGDWSLYEGHYYSNKSPGTTLLGIAAYMPIRSLERTFLTSGKEFSPELDTINAWLLNILLSGLPLAFAAVAFRRLLLRLELSAERASLFTFLMVFGTGMWPYATQLWGLPATGAFLILSLSLFLRGTPAAVCGAGLFFGLAVLFDYSAAVMIPAVGAALLFTMRKPGHRIQPFLFALGGVPMALLYFRYNMICFGGPLRFAFMYNNPIFVDQARTGGIAALPSLRILLELLIGQYRGIFPAMPFLIFAIPGFLLLRKSGGLRKGLAFLAGACILSLLLMNASFNGWHGGYAILPRYLIPSFPAWCLLAAFAPLKKPGVRGIFALTALLSVSNMLAVTICTPVGWGDEPSPVYRMAYATWKDPDPVFKLEPLKLHVFHPDRARIIRRSTTSFGERAGLPRNLSGACLGLTLSILGAALLLTDRARRFLRREARYWSCLLLRKNAFQPDLRWILLILGLVLLFLLPGSASFSGEGARSVYEAWYTRNADCRILDVVRVTGCGPLAYWAYQIMFMIIPHDLVLLLLLKTGITILPVFVIFRLMFREKGDIDGRDPLLFLLFAPLFYLSVRSFSGATLLIPVSAFVLWGFYRLARTGKGKDALLTLAGLWAGALIHPEAGLPACLAFALWLPLSGILRNRKGAVVFCAGAALLPVLVRLLPVWHRGAFPGWGTWSLTAVPIRALSWQGVISEVLPEADQVFSPALLRFWNGIGLLSLAGCLVFFAAGLGHLFRKRHELKTDPTAALGIFALLSVLAAFPVMLTMKPDTPVTTAALPVFLPAALIAGLGMTVIRRIGDRAGRVAPHFFCVMAACLLCFLVLLERNGGSPGPKGYGPMLKNQLFVERVIRDEARHARYIQIMDIPEYLRADPMIIKFLSDFLMKNNPPVREKAVKTMEGIPVRIVLSGPPGTGFIRAEPAEEEPVRQQE